jgi:hypothetical protein
MDDMCSWVAAMRQWVDAHWEWESIREFGNSTFFTSLVGALAGAWAGGRVAQILATKAKDKEELTKDIRNSNAAATMASSLCDDLSGLMGQHVKELKKAYDADRIRFEAVLAAPAPTGGPQVFTANLQFLNTPSLNTEVLQSLIYSQVSNNYAIKAFSALDQAIANVKSSNAQRNALIAEYRDIPDQQAALRFLYFGQPHPAAGTDDRYRGTLSSIYNSLQDGIYLSMHLSLLLCEHSSKLGKRFKKKHGRPVPKAQQVDFTRLADRGLLPDRKNYPDWDVLFYPPAEPTWWQRVKPRLLRITTHK